MKRRTIAAALVFALCFSHTYVYAQEEDQPLPEIEMEQETIDEAADAGVASGSCGLNLNWELLEEADRPGLYTLKITGSGEMEFDSFFAPWSNYSSGITQLELPEGLTNITAFAFEDCSNLTGVQLPAGLRVIGREAFKGCGRLKNVTLPTGLEQIQDQAFYSCGLRNITIPGSVGSDLGAQAFSNTRLTAAVLEEGITTIPRSCFENCESLETITLPSTVWLIDSAAFGSCKALQTVLYPGDQDDWSEIELYEGNAALSKAYYQTNNITPLYEYAYESCGDSIYCEIRGNVVSGYELYIFGAGDFYEDFTVRDSLPDYADYIHTVTISDGVTGIDAQAFSGLPDLASVSISSTVTGIGEQAFAGCGELAEIQLSGNLGEIKAGLFRGCEKLASVAIPESVTAIGEGAFAGCRSLTAVTIPDSVTAIGPEAFSHCEELTSVKFSENASAIEEAAFAFCGKLVSIQIPAGVHAVKTNAFEGCSALEQVTYGGSQSSWEAIAMDAGNEYLVKAYYRSNHLAAPGVTVNGSCGSNLTYTLSGNFADGYALTITGTGPMRDYDEEMAPWSYYMKDLASLSIANGVTYIGNAAFRVIRGDAALTDLVIPDSVTAIGENAFSGCNKLERITLPKSVTMIGQRAFSNCSSLKAVDYSGTDGDWEEIGIDTGNGYLKSAFFMSRGGAITGRCGDDLTYTLAGTTDSGYNLTVSGTGRMWDCAGSGENDARFYPVKQVTIRRGVTYIGAYAFSECGLLKSVAIPSGVEAVGAYAFAGAGLTELIVDEGVAEIGENACLNCSELQAVTLPKSLKRIEENAFSQCQELGTVYYAGSVADWDAMVIGDGNEALASAKIQYNYVDTERFEITEQPEYVNAGVNAQVSFRIAAVNAASYQWQYSKNGGAKWINCSAAGNTTDAISLKVTASNSVNIYRCVVTGLNGKKEISESAGVYLIPGAVITLNPKSNAVALGEYAIFTVETENAAGFQWQYSKDGAHWYRSNAEGSQTDTLTVKGEQKSQGNRYRCVVTGLDGNTKKSYMAAMIVMTKAPQACSAAVGEMASYSLKAEGIAEYQWQYSKDGGTTWYKSNAEGATTDTVTFRASTSNRAMIYRCKLTTPDEATAFTKAVGFK